MGRVGVLGLVAVATVWLGFSLSVEEVVGAPAAAGDEREVLLQLDRDFDKDTAEKGAEGWAAYFAENGAMLPSGGHPIIGPEAIRNYMAGTVANPDFSLRWRPLKAEIWIPADLGYTLGRWERKAKNKEGKTEVLRGTYVTIWKKQTAGSWKIILDTGSPDGPPTVVD